MSVRVFISYSHDSAEHEQWVLDLAARLRGDDVEAWIDQYASDPDEGWPRWMQTQVEAAQFVIAVCTETWRRRFLGQEVPGKGKGAIWEGMILTQDLYEGSTLNRKIVPVAPDAVGDAFVPPVLRPYTRYMLPSQYDGLYRKLTGQPKVLVPPLGKAREMPPVNGPGVAPPAPPVKVEAPAPRPMTNPSLRLEPTERRELHGLLVRLFPSYGELKGLVQNGLDTNLATLASESGGLDAVVLDLLTWCEARAKTAALVEALAEARAGVDDAGRFRQAYAARRGG